MNYINHIACDIQARLMKENRTDIFMHLYIIIWQEEQRHNVRSKPDNTISIFMTKGAKSLNLWAPISVIMKQEYRGVQKKWIKCESAKMVCTVDTQLTSANLLLVIWLCSFRVDTLMRTTLGSYNKTKQGNINLEKNHMKSHEYC